MVLFRKYVEVLSLNLDRLGRTAIFLLMLLVVSNVIGRRLFGFPVRGTVEGVEFLAAMAIGLCLAYCAVKGGHVAVGFMTDRLSPKKQVIIEIFIKLLSLAFLLLACWRIVLYADRMYQTGQISLTLSLPYFPFVLVIAFGFLFYGVVLILEIMENIGKAVKN
jgi:TRAP-type C4-dicarboxylate transport system permease small subunit